MGNRKEEILIVALHLFARDGYEAVSVSQIAGELDMTKGALYRHYKSKRDIFDCIVQRMEQQDSEQARQNEVPEESIEKMPEEYQKVENLVRESFWNVYRPGCLDHYVLHQLRNDLAFVPELDFVMLLNEKGKEDKLIGQNMFMRTSIKADDGRNIPIMTMGPICIKNEYKRKGYGRYDF